MCGRSQDEIPLEVDHIVAVAHGGTDELHNLATLCRDCNLGKSDYRFTSYAEMNIIPEGLERYLKFYLDHPTGDFERYHLYCYYRDASDGLPSQKSFHRQWTISATDLACTGGSDLPVRRRETEMIEFKKEIRLELIAQRRRLVATGDGLVKQ